ncbi:nucleotidyltransferase domain-containing protein [Thermococcus sp. SY098]|uniref:nucleotidyltransferase domain-containing protein n=1 Tax=Thermococcus sp. SY098 TaxID=3111325 RepID=UPI002D79B3D2|nr:nucleotidyltransferase domain-containing protein [Thermococcus sp. SY098]WRS53182.1 nucleotidyltransferase domain-containing protein [Thermococcus sp. SY098]
MLPYKKEIDKYTQTIKEKLNPKLIVLHGSIAKGTFGVGSDVDILVISDELPKNFNERLKLLYLLDETSAPMDIKGYTTKEFQKMILKGHPLALDALEEGIVLFADENYLREIKKLFTQAKKKFKRIEKGWMRIER